jgi:hypothetical protein
MIAKPEWDKSIDKIPYMKSNITVSGVSDEEWRKIRNALVENGYLSGYKRALDAIRQRAGQPGNGDMDDSCMFCPLLHVRVDSEGEADTSCPENPCPLDMVVKEIIEARKEADAARISKFADDYIKAGRVKP